MTKPNPSNDPSGAAMTQSLVAFFKLRVGQFVSKAVNTQRRLAARRRRARMRFKVRF